jgi:hypothetical protein
MKTFEKLGIVKGMNVRSSWIDHLPWTYFGLRPKRKLYQIISITNFASSIGN